MCKEEREFHRKSHGLILASIVRGSPFSDFRRESSFDGKFRETPFDITGGGGFVTGENISPVTLCVDQKLLLSELHKRIANGGITMGMILHSIAHDICNLIEMTVINRAHRMQDSSLHRFQAVVDIGDSAFENHIACIFKIPGTEHS